MGGMEFASLQISAPPHTPKKPPLPPKTEEEKKYNRVTALAKHMGGGGRAGWYQETLGYGFDTKKFGNSFCFKKSNERQPFCSEGYPCNVLFSCPNAPLVHGGGISDFSKQFSECFYSLSREA